MQYLIGIDIGTQGTKATLCDENGQILREGFEASRLIYPEPGAVEQDPQEMLDSVLHTIRDVVESSGVNPKDVVSIGVDGQMAGVMAVDADGLAVGPYDSWLDTRCGAYCEPFLSLGEAHVIQLTGAPVTYAHGPKILWRKAERPEEYARIASFVQPAAYCVMRLCGLRDAYIDHTYLHFSGFADTERRKWSEELLSELGVAPDKMPRIVAPWEVMGGLTRAMAEAAGLPEGTRVVAGCGDTAASSFGAGIHRPGLLFDVAGTASVFACAVRDYTPDTQHKTLMFPPAVLSGLYTPMAYISGGGMCLKWLRDDVLGKRYSFRELDEMAAEVSPGSEDLLFVPHFSGRVCPNDARVRGSFVGLSWQHKAAHMYRAIMESIAYEYRIYADILRELSPDVRFEQVISVGGGSKSAVFQQIKADALGVPFSAAHAADTAAIGACAIAGYGVGLYRTPAELVEKLGCAGGEIRPNPQNTPAYTARKAVYAELIDALHGVYTSLAKL